ncbi:MAG: alpha-D-glucose phosphate-specific phosphoglucomutase [Caulobacteraceae bacterium]|nr:alpha-D-glucose phosphate-specific phosphoglucomutase [Caulobacteraceae bacterium]
MPIAVHAVTPFDDQKPGTSGLRKPTRRFMEPGYLPAFVQAILECAPPKPGAALIVGGDGRFFVREAAETVIRMAAAAGYARVRVGREALLSTPAASHLVRLTGAQGAVILSASHNPGGPDGDFGVKYNTSTGGPAPESLTEAIFARSKALAGWRIETDGTLDLDRMGEVRIGACVVEVIDPVAAYADLMESLFDFAAIRGLLASGFRMRFDAMHAVTGPYAMELFERRLGAPAGTVMNATPLPDFGGGHPDPHPDHAPELMAAMSGPDALDFGAASDGDGDRNMIVGPGGFVVSPGDSLAILTALADRVPAYSGGVAGVARSMPTARAADRVAEALGVDSFETPTGWKWFVSLMDAGRITLCGEESFGTGSSHVREKDGLWAVLFWLNLLAVERVGVRDLVRRHWSRFGRDAYRREDYEGLETGAAGAFMQALRARLDTASGQAVGPFSVVSADDFAYVDPVDGSGAEGQGVRVMLTPDARITYRLSGTGSSGATLRVYLETYLPRDRADADPSADLDALSAASREFADVGGLLGRAAPSVVTG